MNARKILLLSLLLVAGLSGLSGLSGCNKNANEVLTADEQRHNVLIQTREASYSVFPDTDDANKLNDPTMLDAMHAETANGSAFGVRSDGLVFTNVHVIEGTNYCTGRALEPIPGHPPPSAEDIAREEGRQKEESLRSEGKSETHCLFVNQSFTKVYRVRLVKLDKVHDVALMCIEKSDGALPHLKLAPEGSFKEGYEVLTIGAPLGNTNMMTLGYLSNLDYVADEKETGKKGVRKIQFSAHILPGNSGGPLVSVATGKIVGQVVAIIALAGGRIATGMSYANPVEDLRANMADAPACNKK